MNSISNSIFFLTKVISKRSYMEDYYLKLKKQSNELFKVSIAAIILHIGYGYLGTFFYLHKKIAFLIIVAIIIFIIMMKVNRKKFKDLKIFIISVKVTMLLSCAAYIVLLVIGIGLCIILCFISAFLLAYPIITEGGDLFREMILFTPSAGCGIYILYLTIN